MKSCCKFVVKRTAKNFFLDDLSIHQVAKKKSSVQMCLFRLSTNFLNFLVVFVFLRNDSYYLSVPGLESAHSLGFQL